MNKIKLFTALFETTDNRIARRHYIARTEEEARQKAQAIDGDKHFLFFESNTEQPQGHTLEQKLFYAANDIYASAGLTPTPEQEQHNRRDAADWTADILTGKATEADFLEAIKDTILDIFATREEATATANA